MLAAIGMFVFDLDTGLFDQIGRRRTWRHERTEVFGARAQGQFLGPGDDEITLSGALVPALAGKYSSLEQIAAMADTGEAYPFSDGAGTIYGHFTIEGLDETHKYLTNQGKGRWVDFTLTLQRAAEQPDG